MEWKCRGVGPAGLATTVGASSLTLGGLLEHMAYVEVDWFLGDLHGRDLGPPWSRFDDSEVRAWAWASAREDSPDELLALWRGSVERARAAAADALAAGGLDTMTARAWPDGVRPTVRWILLHMIEEYARHNGHADLLREAVDGSVGE